MTAVEQHLTQPNRGAATHLTPPDGAPVAWRERLHAVIGDGYHVSVSSARELRGEQYCSVLVWLKAIRVGFESREREVPITVNTEGV